MDRFLIENFEGYRDGSLGEAARREFESRLARCRPGDRARIGAMLSGAGLFASMKVPEGASASPSPGFHLRVLRRIREEGSPAVWDFFMQPQLLWRVSLASGAWLLLLFSTSLPEVSTQPSEGEIAQAVLAKPPESADYCNVRLGCDIEGNRSSMLATVMVSGAQGR